MKKSKLIALAAACALTVTAFPMLVHGDDAVYDPSSDPLVSLSYITEILTPAYDEKLNDLEEAIVYLESRLASLTLENNTLKSEIKALQAADKALEENLSSAEGYQVVYMQKGSKLLAESPCEIILRSGTAIVVSITTNGLNNISTGTEYMNAEEVPLYHCLLVPRGGDGRGIQITSGDAYVMVRGDYQLVN